VHPISALQSEYSLWFRDREQDVLPVCRELGITSSVQPIRPRLSIWRGQGYEFAGV
jgi:hypothetical protein